MDNPNPTLFQQIQAELKKLGATLGADLTAVETAIKNLFNTHAAEVAAQAPPAVVDAVAVAAGRRARRHSRPGTRTRRPGPQDRPQAPGGRARIEKPCGGWRKSHRSLDASLHSRRQRLRQLRQQQSPRCSIPRQRRRHEERSARARRALRGGHRTGDGPCCLRWPVGVLQIRSKGFGDAGH